MKEIQQLIEISQFYGRDSRFVIAGVVILRIKTPKNYG